MSVLSALDGRDGPGKTVMAEVPVVLQPSNRLGKQTTPQERLDRFWKKFTTETPGKATTVIPRNKTTAKAAKDRTNVVSSTGTTTTKSYEEAAAICRAKVDKIVKECRRINQKYRDPHFDLEFDLKLNRRDCLDALDNEVKEVDSSSDEGGGGRRHRHQRSRSRSHSRRRRRRRRRRGHTGPLVDMNNDELDLESKVLGRPGKGKEGEKKERKAMAKDNQQRLPFVPRAVKRVGEIFDEPKFYIDGPTANDVRQGRDGDCWLMAALCTLSNKAGLIERICVARDEAVGVYGFVFHRDGEWISEIIDDKLYLTKPDYDEINLERLMWEDRDRINSEETYRKTYQANSGALYFAQCEDPNETWLPLLEKAYAKAHGDYSAIDGGFTGEGIEDLTGGVTSELFTTDILDKEYFWKEELMRVNEQFLFGCSTGVWGHGWGERKGIMELHAYSVMRAVEIDGERLVLLKNPWGKGEWNGPWSDGSKEWTPEWLKKLDHRFGDDGAFWISYQDLLRKYQAFDRTRLFGPEWKVTSTWTTLSVPWTLEYHDTKFAFTMARQGPVVLVLSQLDERYFRGLEGQYRFELSFRVHRAGEEDYIVRSQTTYRMNRSVNVELELEKGEYHVLVKIDATRDRTVMPAEDVVRANAREKREKLIRIGLAYDVAHTKGKIVESPEEKSAREAYEKWKRDKEKRELKETIMKERARTHYIQVKRLAKNRKAMEKRKAKQKAREEKAAAEEEKMMAARCPPVPGGMSMRPGNVARMVGETVVNVGVPGEEQGQKGKECRGEVNGKDQQSGAHSQTEERSKPEPTSVKDVEAFSNETASSTPRPEIEPKTVNPDEGSVKDGNSSVGQGEDTPTSTASERSMDCGTNKEPPDTISHGQLQRELPPPESTSTQDFAPSADLTNSDDNKGKQPEIKQESVPTSDPASTQPKETTKPSKAAIVPEQEQTAESADVLPESDDLSHEETFHSAHQGLSGSASCSSDASDSDVTDNPNWNATSNQQNAPPHHSRHRPSNRNPGKPTMPPSGFHPPGGYHGPPPPHTSGSRRMPMPMPVPMRSRHPPPPPPGAYASDNDSLSSISSPSDISDRELEYHLEDEKSRTARIPLPPVPQNRRDAYMSDSDDEFERDPWNAVTVVGLRVYYKIDEKEEKDRAEGQTVKIRVIRPVFFPVEKDGETGGKKLVLEGTVKETGMDESMVLDLDDSAKDATLQAGEKVEVEDGTDGKRKTEGMKGADDVGVDKDGAGANDDKKKDDSTKDVKRGG